MNRRDFVKALAGIPLLGLLVKPEGELKLPGYPDVASYLSDLGAWHTMTYDTRLLSTNNELYETAYKELALDATKQPAFELSNDGGDWMVERYKDEDGNQQTRVMFGTPPTDLHWDDDPTPGISYWNGEKWIRM